MTKPVRNGSARGLVASQAALLLRNDARRIVGELRRPRPGVWTGVLLPLSLVAGALWVAGDRARPDLSGAEGAVIWGFLITAPIAFFAYGVLFRPADDPFLRRLGISGPALFAVRALRLLGLGLATAAVALLPFAAAGESVNRPLAIGTGAALAAWALAALGLSLAARSTTPPDGPRRPGIFSLMMGPDAELVSVAPLFYAPLAPLLGGPVAAGIVGAAPGAAWLRVLLLAVAAAAVTTYASTPFARALPRFAARAQEMAFAPVADAGQTGLVLDRGLARLLPSAAAAVRARDALVVARRFRWATGIIWPTALVSGVALARWGEDADVRVWVALAACLTLLAQGGAIIGLGRLERSRARWIDRATGIAAVSRWLGRWAVGFGLSLWLTIPLALVWAWFTPAFSGWVWLLAGAATAAAASLASLAAAGK